MNSLILDSLNYYYTLKKIDKKSEIKYTNEFYNLMPVLYITENNNYIKKVYNVIGIYDTENSIFHWAWSTNLKKHTHIKTDQLILHGVNIEGKNLLDMYIKKLLTSSQIFINNNFQITYIMAIACYLTKSNGFFVESESNYLIFYGFYDIKDSENIEIIPKI
jgi:hypothetical protein